MTDTNEISSYDFDLPEALIAEVPSTQREGSRILMASIDGEWRIQPFRALLEQLQPNDLLVFNDSRVVPARVFGTKPSGGRVELLVLDVLGDDSADRWTQVRGRVRLSAMYKSSKRLSAGTPLALGDGSTLDVVDVTDGLALIEVDAPQGVAAWLAKMGEIPLPPYIVKQRLLHGTDYHDDQTRYQTVFAARPGSVAAPTAGLHFSEEILDELAARGVRRAFVTLEVGPGTFQPVKAERLSEHEMHYERYFINDSLRPAIDETRERGGRVVAVGTTSIRVLETEIRLPEPFQPGTRRTNLFLRPGNDLRVVDAFVTNFHLPKSTLLALVAAYAGLDRVMELYQIAIANRMRFYSYGDAMFLTREALR
ncbi:MAG: tRNA preQ1(34) S-adenosylmethionine ribosyltransferase-isomerase QueA [bacterium]